MFGLEFATMNAGTGRQQTTKGVSGAHPSNNNVLVLDFEWVESLEYLVQLEMEFHTEQSQG